MAQPLATWPLPKGTYSKTDSFGVTRPYGPHTGVDYGAPMGTDVYAPITGKVVGVASAVDYGTYIVIEDEAGGRHQFSHLSAVHVKQGQRVEEGQLVGSVGSTGNSSGPHLDWEYTPPGQQRVDPLGWWDEQRNKRIQAAGSGRTTTGAASRGDAGAGADDTTRNLQQYLEFLHEQERYYLSWRDRLRTELERTQEARKQLSIDQAAISAQLRSLTPKDPRYAALKQQEEHALSLLAGLRDTNEIRQELDAVDDNLLKARGQLITVQKELDKTSASGGKNWKYLQTDEGLIRIDEATGEKQVISGAREPEREPPNLIWQESWDEQGNQVALGLNPKTGAVVTRLALGKNPADERQRLASEAALKAQQLQNEIALGRLKREEATEQFDQWLQVNVEMPLKLYGLRQQQEQEERLRASDEARLRMDQATFGYNMQQAAEAAGERAVRRELDTLPSLVGPTFAKEYAAGLNALMNRTGENVTFSPESFTYEMPDLKKIAADETARVLAAISPHASGLMQVQPLSRTKPIDVDAFLAELRANAPLYQPPLRNREEEDEA